MAQMQAYAVVRRPGDPRGRPRGLRRPRQLDRARLGRRRRPSSARFFAQGMLLNVIASMDLLDSDEPWAQRLLEGCRDGQ